MSKRGSKLSYEELNIGEQAVVTCLRRAGSSMKIAAIAATLGWSKAKGNSQVRNALRRPVRDGLVLFAEEIGRGSYVSADTSAGPSPRPVLKADLPLWDEDDIEASWHENVEFAERARRPGCTFYNACLDQAISGKWQGFSCTSCNAYSEPDMHQRQMNHLGLRAVQAAIEMVEKYGKVSRKRGVKPGADAKRTKPEETVSLSEALAMAD